MQEMNIDLTSEVAQWRMRMQTCPIMMLPTLSTKPVWPSTRPSLTTMIRVSCWCATASTNYIKFKTKPNELQIKVDNSTNTRGLRTKLVRCRNGMAEALAATTWRWIQTFKEIKSMKTSSSGLIADKDNSFLEIDCKHSHQGNRCLARAWVDSN